MALTRIDSYLVDLDSLGGITFDDQAGTPTFKVDATTHRVGIGTASPTSLLDVAGDVTIADKIIHGGDTNTSIRFPEADTFTVETAGSERVRVTSSGNVGIGITNPAFELQVGSGNFDNVSGQSGVAITAASQIFNTFGTGGDLVIRAQRPTDVGGGSIALGGSTRGDFRPDSVLISTANNPRVFVNSTGNVGIGTTNPGALLDVYGTSRFGGTTSAGRRVDITTDGILTLAYGNNTNSSNLILQNVSDVASTTNHGNSVLWQFGTSASTTPINAGRVNVLKEQQWTATTTTQDSYFSVDLAVDGVLTERLKLTSAGGLTVSTVTTGSDISLNGELNFTTAGNKYIDFYTDNDAGVLSTAFLRLVNTASTTFHNAIAMARGGAVTLYHNNASKLATTSTGVDITGDLTVSGGDITAGNVAATLFAGNTTTNIAIGSGLTTGTFTVGATGSTGAVSLFPAEGAQNITLGGATTGTVTIGSTSATAVQLPTGKTKIGQTFLVQGGAVNITLPTSAGTLYASGNTDVALADGGTNASLTAVNGGVVYSTASAMAISAAGTAGQALVSAGAAAPSFQTLTLENLPDAWVKRTVKAATTANLSVASSTLTTLTGTLVVFPTQDGITISVGDRLLVKDQTTAAQNGIYTLTTAGVAGTTAWVLTRAADADTASELAGSTVSVDQGTTQGGFIYDTNFKTTDTVGSTDCNFSRILDTGAVSGDATVANSGTLTIADDAVTYAKIQNVSATDRLLGRSTADAGVIEEIACTAAGRALLDDADAAAQRTTLGLGTIATQASDNVSITGGSVTGITDVTLADGGTNASLTASAGSVVYSTASAMAFNTAGTSGQLLVSKGTSAPAYESFDLFLHAPHASYKSICRVATTEDLNAYKFDSDVLTGYSNTVTLACTTAAGSATVTTISTAGIKVGAVVSGNANIPAGRTVASIVSATQFTLNSGTSVLLGTSVATTFTQTIAALTIDGVALAVNDRVLVKDQTKLGGLEVATAAKYNGIYRVTETGSTTDPWKLTRTDDAIVATDLDGAIVNISEGTANFGKSYKTRFSGTSTLNTTEMYWSRLVDVNSSNLISTPTTAIGIDLSTDTETIRLKTGNVTDLVTGLSIGVKTISPLATSTYATASSFYIAGAPAAGTNATITTAFALNVAAGNSNFGGNITSSGNLTVSGGTITAGNVATTLLGGNTTTNITIGAGLTSGTLTLGSANGSGTISIGNTGTAAAQAVNIATATTGTITIGGAGATAVQLPTGKTKIGQSVLLQGGAVNITLPTLAGTLYASGNTDVALADGGTNASLTAVNGGVVWSNATQLQISAAGSSGQFLQSNGAAAPTWKTLEMSDIPGAVYKKSVKAATTADLGTVTYSNGTAGVGATLTGPTGASAVVFPDQDGVTIALNDRLLVKNQTTAARNGIYTLTTVGVAGTTAWVLTRATDADTNVKIGSAVVAVDQGTANGGEAWTTNFKSTDTVGTTAMSWNEILYNNFSSSNLTLNSTENYIVNPVAIGRTDRALLGPVTTFSTTPQTAGLGYRDGVTTFTTSPAAPGVGARVTLLVGGGIIQSVVTTPAREGASYAINQVLDVATPESGITLTAATGSGANATVTFSAVSALSCTSSGSGTTVTLTFAAQTYAPYPVGSTITVSGLSIAGHNGTFTVTGGTTSTVTYANTTTGSGTGGTVSIHPFTTVHKVTIASVTPSNYNATNATVISSTATTVTYAFSGTATTTPGSAFGTINQGTAVTTTGKVTVNSVRQAGLSILNTSYNVIRLEATSTTSTSSSSILGNLVFSAQDSNTGGQGDKVQLRGVAEGTSGGGRLEIWTSANGGEPSLGFAFGGSNDFRLYNSTGTFYHTFSNNPTANRTITLPDANVSFANAFTTSGAFPLTLTTTASTNVTLPITGTLATLGGAETFSGVKTFNANPRLNDNIELEIGTGVDWELFHDGTNNYMDLNVGDLLIRDNTTTRFTFARTTGNLTITGDLEVNGGDITTSSTGTCGIFNTSAITQLNIGGDTTTLALGRSGTGNSTINIGTNSLGTGNTRNINIGTTTSSGATSNVTIGVNTGSLKLRGSTVNLTDNLVVGSDTTSASTGPIVSLTSTPTVAGSGFTFDGLVRYTITGSTGSSATVYAAIGGGIVRTIYTNDEGYGYTSGDTISLGSVNLYFSLTGASGNGTTATITFATQTNSGTANVVGNGTTATITFSIIQDRPPFPVGSRIVVSGFTSTAAPFNGTYTVTACTTSTVSYAHATVLSLTTATNGSIAIIPFVVGSKVTVTGINPSGYNVTAATITAATSTSVSYANTTTAAYVSGGGFIEVAPTVNAQTTITGVRSANLWTVSTSAPKLRIESSDTSVISGDILGEILFSSRNTLRSGGDRAKIITSVTSSVGCPVSLEFWTADTNAMPKKCAELTSVGRLRLWNSATTYYNDIIIQPTDNRLIYFPDSSGTLATLGNAETFSGAKTFTANPRLNDSVELEFGTGIDMEIHHDGTNNYIDLNNGNLLIRDNTTTRFTFERTTGNFTATGNINSNSDIKLKTNIKTISNPLDKVIKLRGVEYNRIDMNNERQIGVIAQEVEKIIPELVGCNEGTKTVSYGNITAILIEAIKEQQKQIEELRSEIEGLKNK